MTKIEWTERTWNPIAGCSVVSPGCTNCYAMKMAHRLSHTEKYKGLTKVVNGKPVWTGEVRQDTDALGLALRVRKPTMWFVNSMSDMFHEGVSAISLDLMFDVMRRCPQHTFQILTKRPGRMLIYTAMRQPLPNVWLGTSVEDRKRKDRIDVLRKVPAAVRFLSLEPLLDDLEELDLTGIHWVIVGGESGPGARPYDLQWARDIIRQCKAAGVPVFHKQVGRNPFSKTKEPPFDHWALSDGPQAFDNGPFYAMLRDPKGGDPSEWPADLRVREFPME